MNSNEYNALKSNTVNFIESNIMSLDYTSETQGNGVFIIPSKNVPGRISILGYVLSASNEEGKLEWTKNSTTEVSGEGSIWFSDSNGNPEGDEYNLYWNDTTKKLGINLNGIEPQFSIDTLGGIRSDKFLFRDTISNKSVEITSPDLSQHQSYNLILPSSGGNIGQVLATDGNGNLSWINNGSGGGNIVPGEGTIWFSTLAGTPTGNTSVLNWTGSSLNVIGNINTTGLITALNFKALSDITLKENINPLENPLDKINKIDGYSYNLKNKPSQKQWGVVAQQLEKQKELEHLVDENNKGQKVVDYNQIIPLLVESIKELTKELNYLKK
jgi:hypothetical protein